MAVEVARYFREWRCPEPGCVWSTAASTVDDDEHRPRVDYWIEKRSSIHLETDCPAREG